MAMLSVMLLVAINMERRKLFLPWLLGVVVFIISDMAIDIWIAVIEAQLKHYPVMYGTILALIVSTLLNIYCILCVTSHYQELGDYEYYYNRIMNYSDRDIDRKLCNGYGVPANYDSLLPPYDVKIT
ncbi:uncharacterized protein LOC100374281 [Saccoglossus kowalevskii]|uniref:Uncharacterized protein LOC100374281 n=1 Tax=Saccoglossus kowalevskii TaxID=10224 RepID=A0ABM0GTG3_SACKO|nr:PREDICTED: uncharacterized protein LOC100374281 [Saccoglossus kowalevskii]